MGPFEMIVAIVLIATFGKIATAFASRPRKESGALPHERIERLEAQLQTNDARVAQTEEKVAELNEKLEFMENLLARPERPATLRGGSSTP